MKQFFYPKSIAIVGASSVRGKIGYEILANISKSGGVRVYPVNPKRTEILGLPCYPNVEAINDEVDLAVLAIDAEACVDAIEQCGRKGIKHVIIVSGGFREVAHTTIEETIKKRAHQLNMRIIGPNCIGVFSGDTGFNTFFQRHMQLPDHGPVAIITQSGTFGIALLEKCAEEGIGVSSFVSYGNKLDVNEIDIIEYLEHDQKTKFIIMYVEDIDRAFFKRTFKKPIIILKTGRNTLGQRAAQLHTGAMASDYRIFKGVCRQKHIIFADDFQEFFGIVKILAMQGLPKGKKIVIITNGAGPGVLVCDFIHKARTLSLHGDIVDLTGSATATDYLQTLKKAQADVALLTFVFQDAPLTETLDELYSGLRKNHMVCIALAIGGNFVRKQKQQLVTCSIPTFEEPSVVVRSLDKLVQYAMEQ